MIIDILNGNNNYVSYNYNLMEEYDYWCKIWKDDRVKRFWMSEGKEDTLDEYPYIKRCLEDRIVTMNNRERYGNWTFSRFKAQRTRGDYKLQNFWDKFRGELYAFNGVRDVRGYMINISPKWPDKYNIKGYMPHMIRAIEKFARSGKWSEFHYVVECGKNGDHLHAHLVCIPTDPKMIKSYISKGNHNNWFRREFDNKNNKYPVGFVGCCMGRNAIQTISLNNCEIFEDKLKYLQEETKPTDHQNKKKLMDKCSIDFS